MMLCLISIKNVATIYAYAIACSIKMNVVCCPNVGNLSIRLSQNEIMKHLLSLPFFNLCVLYYL